MRIGEYFESLSNVYYPDLDKKTDDKKPVPKECGFTSEMLEDYEYKIEKLRQTLYPYRQKLK